MCIIGWVLLAPWLCVWAVSFGILLGLPASQPMACALAALRSALIVVQVDLRTPLRDAQPPRLASITSGWPHSNKTPSAFNMLHFLCFGVRRPTIVFAAMSQTGSGALWSAREGARTPSRGLAKTRRYGRSCSSTTPRSRARMIATGKTPAFQCGRRRPESSHRL